MTYVTTDSIDGAGITYYYDRFKIPCRKKEDKPYIIGHVCMQVCILCVYIPVCMPSKSRYPRVTH